MLSIVKPKNFMPVHGEATHLRATRSWPRPPASTRTTSTCLKTATPWSFPPGASSAARACPRASSTWDGLSVGDTSQDVLDERNTLGNQGFASVAAAVNMKDRKLVGQVQVSMHGITGGDDYYLAHEAENTVANALRKCLSKDGGVKELRKAARDALLSLLWERTKQRPMVVVNLLEV